MTSRYRTGADFERKVRDHLLANGAVFVVRAAGSKGPVDLVAFYERRAIRATNHPPLPSLGSLGGEADVVMFGPQQWWTYAPDVIFIQAKRTGTISRADKWALCELATQCGAVPMLAKQGPRGTPVVLERLEMKEQAA